MAATPGCPAPMKQVRTMYREEPDMEKMLDRRTSLRIDVALYQRIHAICIEVGIPVGLFIRAAATNVDPGMLETGSKAWKTGIHSFTPVDRRETQGERRRIDLRLSDAEREIIARAAANRHTSRAHFIASQAEQLAGDPRVRDILNRLADLGSDELVRYARTMLETIHATERRMQAGSPTGKCSRRPTRVKNRIHLTEIRAAARQALPRCTSRTGCTTRTGEQVIRIVCTIRTCPPPMPPMAPWATTRVPKASTGCRASTNACAVGAGR